MTSLNNEGRFVLAIRSLSQNIYQRILPLSQKFCDTAQEIRLRVNRPVAVVCPDTTYFLTEKGGLTNTILDGSMLDSQPWRPYGYFSQHFAITRYIQNKVKL